MILALLWNFLGKQAATFLEDGDAWSYLGLPSFEDGDACLLWRISWRGVRQGCDAVPDLFKTLGDYLMAIVTPQISGLAFDQHELKDLEYADDALYIPFCPAA